MMLASIFLGCNEDIEESVSEDQQTEALNFAMRLGENDKPDVHTPIKLGEQLANPYTTANMQAAFNYYNSVVANSPFRGRKVKTSHYYIKILPTTETHLIAMDILDKSDAATAPILHDYPLDYEIIEEGDYYVYPKDEADLYYPAYSVIPVNYQMPSGLPYTILANLYEPTDAEVDVETAALVFADWQDDLVADLGEELHLDGLPQYLKDSYSAGTRLFGRKYTPEGTILVENTDDATMDPLMQSKISVGRSIWWHYTYTDYLGHFRANKTFRGKVRIRAKWRSSTATIKKTWNEILGFWVSDHMMTLTRSSNNRTKNIMYMEPHEGIFGLDLEGGHLWFKGTVHNGLVNYNVYCAFNGIDKPLIDSSVWAFARGDASATPMFNYFNSLPEIAFYANVGQANVWQNLTAIAGLSHINLLPHRLRPDQIFGGLKKEKIDPMDENENANTVIIHQLTFHESGHYSHAKKAGATFLSRLMAAEVSNTIATSTGINLFNGDPYRDGSYPSFQAADRISLAEGWATFTEFKISSSIHSKAFFGGNGVIARGFYPATSTLGDNIATVMENFDVVDRPMNFQRRDDRSWFLHGIMWDLLDNHTENVVSSIIQSQHQNGNGGFLGDIIDNAFIGTTNQFNLAPIFNRLLNNVNSACDLRAALETGNGVTDAPLNQLFITYGYDCGVSLP